LSNGARETATFIEARLRAQYLVSPRTIARLIADLDDDRFVVRQRASRALAKSLDTARAQLEQTLMDHPSLEVRDRVERLLARLKAEEPSVDALRVQRALEVLERLGTPEAKKALERLGKQDPQAWLTQQAKEVLDKRE
jgi:hypothetical protein